MFRLNAPRRCVAALALAVIASTPLRAAPLDDRVPADAAAYIAWAGTDALQAQYAKSNLKGILDASTIREVFEKQWPQVMKQAGGGVNEKERALAEKWVNALVHHPTAFYFRSVDLSNPNMPVPSLGFVMDAGTDAKDLAALLKDLIEQAPRPAPPPLKVLVQLDGNVLHLSMGSADTPDDLKKGGGLAGVTAYKAAMANAKHPSPAAAVYVDATRILAMVNDGLARGPDTPPEMRDRVTKTIDVLGLNGLTQMAYTTGFEEKAWGEHMFVGIKGPRTGVLAMMGDAPLSDAALAVIPKDATTFAAWKMDLHGMFTQVRDLMGKIEPAAQREFDQQLATSREQTGIDIEKDLLAALGDEWVIYRAQPPEGGAPSIALVHKLKDANVFAATLAKVETFANKALKDSPIKIDKARAAKTDVSTIAVLQYSIAWTVKDGYLYVAPLDAIGDAIKQVANKAPSIAESDSYKAAQAALPANVKPMMLSYGNPAKVYPQLRVLGLGVLPFLRSQGIDVPNTIFPDPDDVTPFMTAGASMTWSDADGIHSASRSAFPGAAMVSGQQLGPATVAVGAMGTAVLLPSLAKSREVASRTRDAVNLRQVTMGCFLWAADHGDAFPDDLARLVANGAIPPNVLVSVRAGTAPLTLDPGTQALARTDFAKFSQLVASHTDFIYLGAGIKNQTDPQTIIALEKPGPRITDGVNVAFSDGHVEFVQLGQLPRTFQHTNDVRKRVGLPEVDVAALLKGTGVPVLPDTRDLP